MENQLLYWTQKRTEILERTTTPKFLYKEFLGNPKSKGDKIKDTRKI